MKQVVILASERCLLSTVAGPMDMFLQAGVLWNGLLGKEPSPFFEVKVVTIDGNNVTSNNQMPIVPNCAATEVEQADLVLIPSQGYQFDPHSEDYLARVDWLKNCYEKGADLASICTGAFPLASTGLLDGKTATTHWGVAKQFKAAFPAVELRTDLMVTDEDRLFCGGGLTADLNLSLYLINKYCGREIALQSSRCTLVDLDRVSQLPFSVFSPERDHNDHEILNAQDWIGLHFRENINLDALAEKSGMSLRNFNRRFKAATGETAVKYMQLTRIESVKFELENTRRPFEEIAVEVGYENVSFLRRIFKSNTGLSPTVYRKKFSLS